MAERSRARRSSNPAVLVVGLLLITLVAVGVAFGFGRFHNRGPDPGHLIYAAAGLVISHDLATGEEKTLASVPRDTVNAFPSPNGRYVAYANATGSMWMLDLKTKQRYPLTDADGYPLNWSPDGRLLATDKESFVVVDPTGQTRRLRAGGLPAIWVDRKTIVVGGPDPKDQVKFVDTTGSGDVTLGGFGQLPIAVSPNGKQLLATRAKDTVVAQILKNGLTKQRRVFDGRAYAGATSPTGLVAFAGVDKDKKFGMWVLEGNGTKPLEVVHARIGRVQWAEAGAVLIYQKGSALYAIDVPNGKPKRLTANGVYPSSFAVVP